MSRELAVAAFQLRSMLHPGSVGLEFGGGAGVGTAGAPGAPRLDHVCVCTTLGLLGSVEAEKSG